MTDPDHTAPLREPPHRPDRAPATTASSAPVRAGRSHLRDVRVAVQFMTRLPVGRLDDPGPDLTAASAWFPAVGVLVAATGITFRATLDPLVGTVPATIVAVLTTVVVTGAFHEDGLADSADGLWGGWTPDQRLAIMRDSRLGTYGTVALVGDLALRTSLLAQLDVGGFARASLAAHVLGRVAPLILVARVRPARPDGQGVRAGALSAGGWAVALATAIGVGVLAAGPGVAVLVVAVVVATTAVGSLARRRLGGVTGDLLGAGVRITALLVIAVMVVLLRHDVLPWVW